MTEFITAKVTPATLKTIRLIAAMTGERQYQAHERIARAELARLKAEEQKEPP